MEECELKKFTSTDCGTSSHYPEEETVIKLHQCVRNTDSHLTSLKLNLNDVTSEGQLIARRAGLFTDWANKLVCPKHRYDYGLYWRPLKMCTHPLHTGKAKAYRTVNSVASFGIWQSTGSVVAVGSGICRRCRDQNLQLENAAEVLKVLDKAENDKFKVEENVPKEAMEAIYDQDNQFDNNNITVSINGAQEKDNINDVHSERGIKRLPAYLTRDYVLHSSLLKTNDPKQETVESESELSQETVPLTESQASNWSDDLPVTVKDINTAIEIISKGSVSPIRFRLQTSLDCVDGVTRRLVKRKAQESVDVLLDSIAPGQSTALLKLITDDKPNNEQNEEKLHELIIHLYNEADDNSSRLQLLSMIANNYTKTELQRKIPGLTVWKIDIARQHAFQAGPGKSVKEEKEVIHRSRMDMVKLEHALGFFFNPSFLHISSYGSKEVVLESGSTIAIPEVVRSSCNSVFVSMYEKFCEETGFRPLSTSTLYKILASCTAVKKTNLRGLDNTAADGAVAFQTLTDITSKLEKKGTLTRDDAADFYEKIKCSKLYLKTDFKLHLHQTDECAYHCINYALSDTSDPQLRAKCTHNHVLDCDRCTLLSQLPESLKKAITQSDLGEDEKAEDLQEIDVAGEKIEDWRCHIVRTLNQDEARLSMIENLATDEMVLVMDWAMKYLPAFHRERMKDFYGQKGMNWHISVGIFKDQEGSIKHKTFVHLFDSVRQDWFAVASVLENVLLEVRIMFPDIGKIFIRSDNAGAYHCGQLWQAIPDISERTGLRIVRYDYSEPQSGKSYCDAKIAHMRCKMRMYVAAGGDIQSAHDMKVAIESNKGVTGCHVTIAEVDHKKQTLQTHKWKNVSLFNDLHFEDDGVRIWKAYNIGLGKKLSKNEVKNLSVLQKETGIIIKEHANQAHPTLGLISIARQVSNTVEGNEIGSNNAESSVCSITQQTKLFICPETGCTKQYQRVSSLEEHIMHGRHTLKLERKSTYDQIKIQWAEVCQHMSELSRKRYNPSNQLGEGIVQTNNVSEGWALKKGRKSVRFSDRVKAFLKELYDIGEKNKKKVNPADAVKQLKQARNNDGTKMFGPEEYLQTSQIASFFSRLSVRTQKKIDATNIDDRDLEGLMITIQQEEVVNEFLAPSPE